MEKQNIISEKNYGEYIHYLESNLIGMPFTKIFAYRIMSSLKCLLYIEKSGDLEIIEKGQVCVKKAQDNLLKHISKEGKINLIVILFGLIFLVIGILAIFGIL